MTNLSTLINRLKALQAEHGDLPVQYDEWEVNTATVIDSNGLDVDQDGDPADSQVVALS